MPQLMVQYVITFLYVSQVLEIHIFSSFSLFTRQIASVKLIQFINSLSVCCLVIFALSFKVRVGIFFVVPCTLLQVGLT